MHSSQGMKKQQIVSFCNFAKFFATSQQQPHFFANMFRTGSLQLTPSSLFPMTNQLTGDLGLHQEQSGASGYKKSHQIKFIVAQR